MTAPLMSTRDSPLPGNPSADASIEYSPARFSKSKMPSNVVLVVLVVVPRNFAECAFASASPELATRVWFESPPAPATSADATVKSPTAAVSAATARRKEKGGKGSAMRGAYREVSRSLHQAASTATAAHATIATSAGTRNLTAP